MREGGKRELVRERGRDGGIGREEGNHLEVVLLSQQQVGRLQVPDSNDAMQGIRRQGYVRETGGTSCIRM
jgi:hypothetical protein